MGENVEGGMKILITGANGFIGSYLCRTLSESSKVIGVRRRKSSQNQDMAGFHSNFQWHVGELSEEIFFEDDIDVIVHTAARSPGPAVTVADYLADNIVATQNLIEFAIQKQVRLFIYLSAMSVYGRIESTLVDEDTPVKLSSPYGITKYLAELLLREKKEVIPSVILRLPLVVGAAMKSGWLFNTYKKLLQGEPVHIYNGDSPYNMVHISDVCSLVSSSLNYQPSDCDTFTVSCKNYMSVRQIVDAMKEHTRSSSEIIEDITADNGFTISTERARKFIGFQPKSAKEIVSNFMEEMNTSNMERIHNYGSK